MNEPVIASGAKQSPSRYALRWRLPRRCAPRNDRRTKELVDADTDQHTRPHRRTPGDGRNRIDRKGNAAAHPSVGAYSDWTPLEGRSGFFPEDVDATDPQQFRNVIVR